MGTLKLQEHNIYMHHFNFTNKFLSSNFLKLLIITILLIIITGCASSASVKQVNRLEAVGESPNILIMTPDIKYYLLTASGVPEPHAEWTDIARQNFSNSLQALSDERGIKTVTMEENMLGDTEISYQKLYSAVGTSILIHHFGALKLPTKQGEFDWSMGPGVREFASKYDTDYALFSFYRDYQASGGRIAFAILAAMAGVGVSTGQEFGFASLVDLKTGDIVWFNQVTVGAGELRDKGGARTAVDTLFKDLPES